MEYDLSKIYDALTDGRTLEDVKPGEFVDIKGNIAGFRIPAGGKITCSSHKVTGLELRIVYDDVSIEVGKKYVHAHNVYDAMEPLLKFLDNNIIGELDE